MHLLQKMLRLLMMLCLLLIFAVVVDVVVVFIDALIAMIFCKKWLLVFVYMFKEMSSLWLFVMTLIFLTLLMSLTSLSLLTLMLSSKLLC